LKTFNFMQHQLAYDDLQLSLSESRLTGNRIRLVHIPEELTDNSFIFDPEQMTQWWKEGYAHAEKLHQEGRWEPR